MSQRLTRIIVLAVLPAIAAAQHTSGSSISAGGGAYSSVDYVSVHWGPPDSTQLVAAVIFRGAEPWGRSGSEDTALERQARDSAYQATRARGNLGAGSITRRGDAWVEYDDRTSTVSVLSQSWHVPRRDSALVLLVDRIDSVGGKPVAQAVFVPVTPIQDDMRAAYEHWDTALRVNQRVRTFLDTPR